MAKFIKVCIYPPKTPKNIILSRNSTVLDNISLKCDLTEDISNGNYILDATFLIDEDKLHENIVEEATIRTKVDYGDEYFRISKVRRTTRDITVVARQLTVDETLGLWLEDVRPTKLNCAAALNHLLNGSIGNKNITFTSDIEVTNTSYFIRKKLYEAIHSENNSILNNWGGEVQRRGYNISILKRLGADRGVRIETGKNILGFEDNTDTDSLVTRIKPVGYDGLTIDGFVDSGNIDKYSRPYVQQFNYSDIKVRTEQDKEGFATIEEAKAELIRRAKLEFTQNHVDDLKATYNINFIQLDKTEEYKDMKVLERVFIGDTVTVKVKKLGVDIKVRAVSRKYDVLRQAVKEIKLSNEAIVNNSSAPTVNQLLTQLNHDMGDSKSIAKYMTAMIESGMKNSNVIVRENEILIMDTKDINTATNVWRWNSGALAHSKTGYYGEYVYGITQDGMINASMVLTGILSTVIIQNVDGSFKIDLSKSGGAQFFNNGKTAMEIRNNKIKFYSWFENGDYIGEIGAYRSGEQLDDGSKYPILMLNNDLDSALAIGYKHSTNSNLASSYVMFDKYNVSTQNWVPVMFREKAYFGPGITNSTGEVRMQVNDSGLFLIKNNTPLLRVYDTTGLATSVKLDIPSTTRVEVSKLDESSKENITGKVYDINTGQLIFDSNASTLGQKLVDSARKLIGKPYRWGGNYPPLGSSDGTDCSGLMQWAFNDNGRSITRTTYTQINEGREITDMNDLQLGDLIFTRFQPNPEHVYMYSGFRNGQHWCVEAATEGVPIRERAFTIGETGSMRVRRLI